MSLSNHPQSYKDQDLSHFRYLKVDIETKIEAPKRYQNINSLTIKICTLCLSNFYFGYCLVQLSAFSKNALIQEFGMVTQEPSVHGLFYGLLTLGGAFGAFFSPLLMKRYTRRNLMILLNCGALIVQGLLQYANIYCLCFCRVFQGYFIGNFIGLLPAYISELSPKQLVPKFKIFNQLFFVLGILFAYMLGTFLTKVVQVQDSLIWRLMFGFNIIMIMFVLLNYVFGMIPESPKSYIRKGLKNEAIKVIKNFVKPQYVDEVYKEKLQQVNNQILGIIPDTKELSVYSKKAYFIGFLLPIMQPLTGINAINTQIGLILQNYNFSFGDYVPLIICFVQFWAIYGATYINRQFGRRAIILSGSLALALCDIMIGLCFLYQTQFKDVLWIVFAILIFYMVIYGLTLGPVVWMYVPEIIPASVVPFAATINFLSSTFCLTLSPVLNAAQGTPTVYFCFGGITLIITLINVLGVRQSKGLSAEQIRRSFFNEEDLERIEKLRSIYSKQSDAFSSKASEVETKNSHQHIQHILDQRSQYQANLPSLQLNDERLQNVNIT